MLVLIDIKMLNCRDYKIYVKNMKLKLVCYLKNKIDLMQLLELSFRKMKFINKECMNRKFLLKKIRFYIYLYFIFIYIEKKK